MSDSDDTIEYQCNTCKVQWTPGDEIFTIYDRYKVRQVNIYYEFDIILAEIAQKFKCQYKELLTTIASMIITYAYNKSGKIVVCSELTISKDRVTYGDKIHFTHDTDENIKIIWSSLESHSMGLHSLKNNIIELTYALSIEYQRPGYDFDKKFVICIEDKYYIVNHMTVYEIDSMQRESLGHNLVIAETILEGMDGETMKALIIKDRLSDLAQSSETSIVKKLRLMGYTFMEFKGVKSIWGW